MLEELGARVEELLVLPQKDFFGGGAVMQEASQTAHSSFVRKTFSGVGRGLGVAGRHPKTSMAAAVGGIGYMANRSRRGSQNSPLQGFE